MHSSLTKIGELNKARKFKNSLPKYSVEFDNFVVLTRPNRRQYLRMRHPNKLNSSTNTLEQTNEKQINQKPFKAQFKMFQIFCTSPVKLEIK